MFNTIQIKRRPLGSPLGTAAPTNLSGGELAFNDIDQTLYYGLSTNTVGVSAIQIAGSGAFVSRTLTQDVSGSKTFKDDTTVDANLTVTGNLSVLGTQTVINTETINISGTSTQIDVVNNGTGTGITVNQTGSQDVAEFKDDGATALIIKDGGNVGVGTATPNEKLTVLGSISASEDIYARNGSFTGTLDVGQAATFASTVSAAGAVDLDSTLDVVGATTLQSTLNVTSGATFASTVSANGALTVEGTATLNNDLTVIDYAVVKTSNWVAGVAGGGIEIDSVNKRINVDDGTGSYNTWYTPNSIYSQVSPSGFTISTIADGGAGIKFTPANGSHTNVTQGNLKGNGVNYVEDFIIDGGTF